MGLLMQFSNVNDRLNVTYFDCAPFSIFADEQKILFFGPNTLLNVQAITYDNFSRHFDVMPVQAVLDMISGQSVRGKPITESATVQQKTMRNLMRIIIRDVLRRHSGQQVGGYMMDLVMYNLKRASRVRLIYGDLMNEYQWLDSIFKTTDSQMMVLNIANIADLFCLSQRITFVLGDSDFIGETEWQLMMTQLPVIYDMGLFTTICFEFPPQFEWIQRNLYDSAFAYVPQTGSGWKCDIKLEENTSSFKVKSVVKEDAVSTINE